LPGRRANAGSYGVPAALLAVVAVALVAGARAAPRTPAPTNPAPLHATATHAFVAPDGHPVQLVGLNVIPVFKHHPGQTWPQERYAQIRAKGFTAVRFVLYWDVMEPARGAFDATSFATLDTAVQRARAAGLRVVLDVVHLWGPGGFADVPAWARTGDSVTTVRTNAAPYLQRIAARYRAEPAVAAYDLVNEFHRFPIDQNAVLRTYDALIGRVRAVDPAKIVMIEPTYGDSSIAGRLADFRNLTHRRNVVWSIHDYFAGGDHDGYAADGSPKGRYVFDGRTGYPTPDVAALRAHLLVQLRTTRAARIPMWVGEYGIGDGVPGHDRWIADQTALFARYGLGRAWWEYHTSGPLSATGPTFAWKPWVGLVLGGGAARGAAAGRAASARPAATVAARDGTVVVAAAGDIACDGVCGQDDTARLVTGTIRPQLVLGLGDYQYERGTRAALKTGYDPYWGRFKRVTYAINGGSHDFYGTGDYLAYFNDGGPVHLRAEGSYSFEAGRWHVIALNSSCFERPTCDVAAWTGWLRRDLAAHRTACTLAYWHEPYWTTRSVHDEDRGLRPWVELLYRAGVDVVLQGHNHLYERFAPQTPDDRRDPRRGMVAFTVGTGGRSHYPFHGAPARNSVARHTGTYGVLKLTLRPRGYGFRFVAVPGSSFTDAGSGRCH
jgi:endoglycosylceramidase